MNQIHRHSNPAGGECAYRRSGGPTLVTLRLGVGELSVTHSRPDSVLSAEAAKIMAVLVAVVV
jgi:hypothetical protein